MLKGKNAVVTGSRNGIGFATVKMLAKNGANVWACAREPNEQFEADMRAIADEHGVWVKPVYFDMADKAQIAAGAKQILDEKLSVDILVNNAAINQIDLFMQASMEKIENLFAIDFIGPLALTQKLAKRMIRQKSGSIINVSSVRGLRTAPGRIAYSAAKAALIMATQTLALELASSGIRVNAIAPGQISSERMMKELADKNTAMSNALGRMGTPEEIAFTVLYLASDMSSFITGQTLEASGGPSKDFSAA